MSFYRSLGGGRFASTEHTTGPWTPGNQHMGPPSALVARALDAVPSAVPTALTRVTVEILGPVPVAELTVTATLERPGRSVEMVSGEILAGGRPVVRARAWRVVTTDTAAVAVADSEPVLPPPEAGTPVGRPESWGPGFLDIVEWRALTGTMADPGPATLWARQRVPLVDGEETSPLERLMVIGDCGNGVSGTLDARGWYFINTELTVHIARLPEGEWIGLDAHSVIGPAGTGTAFSVLHDERGPVARGAQALMVRPR